MNVWRKNLGHSFGDSDTENMYCCYLVVLAVGVLAGPVFVYVSFVFK